MWELVLIFVVVLLLFGAKRLPEIGSSLGKGIREFKGSLREIEGELKVAVEDERKPPPRIRDPESDGAGEPRRLTTTEPVEAPRPAAPPTAES